MAKTKNKNHSELESLRGYCRELEKNVRSLQKQLRQFEKYEQRNAQDSETATDTEDTYVEKKFTVMCSSCEKNKMVETLDLGSRGLYGECICGHKGRMK